MHLLSALFVDTCIKQNIGRICYQKQINVCCHLPQNILLILCTYMYSALRVCTFPKLTPHVECRKKRLETQIFWQANGKIFDIIIKLLLSSVSDCIFPEWLKTMSVISNMETAVLCLCVCVCVCVCVSMAREITCLKKHSQLLSFSEIELCN